MRRVRGAANAIEDSTQRKRARRFIRGRLYDAGVSRDLRSGLDFGRFVIPERYDQRLTTIWVVKRTRVGVLQLTDADRASSLQLAHSRLNFAIIDRFPHGSGPMLVEFVRIFDEKNVVGIDLNVAGLVR